MTKLDRVVSAKVPGIIVQRLREAANATDRTLSGQIRRVLRDWAEAQAPVDLL